MLLKMNINRNPTHSRSASRMGCGADFLYSDGSIDRSPAYSLPREGKDMTKEYADAFRCAVSALGEEARRLLGPVSEQEMALAGELRLRVGAPAVLSLPDGVKTLGTSPVTRSQMDSMVLSLCGHSIYSHQHEIAAGFISLPGGHRAGVCGRAVVSDGKVTAVRDIGSICLRIARDYRGCAGELADRLFSGGLCSAVIAGAPSSGKTTLLRDMACILADGICGRRMQVALVDERGEFSAGSGRIFSRCDILTGYPKSEGIIDALRSLSPDVIICDELGGESDISAVESGINAGVHILCSMHAGTADELAKRPQTAALIKTGGFRRFVLLSGRDKPGSIARILDSEEVYEMACGADDNAGIAADGIHSCGQAASKKKTA